MVLNVCVYEIYSEKKFLINEHEWSWTKRNAKSGFLLSGFCCWWKNYTQLKMTTAKNNSNTIQIYGHFSVCRARQRRARKGKWSFSVGSLSFSTPFSFFLFYSTFGITFIRLDFMVVLFLLVLPFPSSFFICFARLFFSFDLNFFGIYLVGCSFDLFGDSQHGVRFDRSVNLFTFLPFIVLCANVNKCCVRLHNKWRLFYAYKSTQLVRTFNV